MKQSELIHAGPVEILAPQDRLVTSELAAMLIQAAKDPKTDPSKVSAFLDLIERLDAKEAAKAFADAMVEMQKILPRIAKNGSISYGSDKKTIKFAQYHDIMTAVGPILHEYGFSFTFGTAPSDKGITVTAKLTHKLGHFEIGAMPLPFDKSGGKNDIQSVGSAITYARRYLIVAMLNLVTEDDNDGSGGFISEEQKAYIRAQFVACNMDDTAKKLFLKLMKSDTLDEIPARAYEMAKTQLANKLRKVQAAEQPK